MKLIKKMTVLSLAVLALGGCTQSSISSNAPDMVEGVDPAKMNQEGMRHFPEKKTSCWRMRTRRSRRPCMSGSR